MTIPTIPDLPKEIPREFYWLTNEEQEAVRNGKTIEKERVVKMIVTPEKIGFR